MRALDLYSGIGGWSLGLKFAGIDVVDSYEIWPDAVATYNANLGKRRKPTDLRTMNFRDLPQQIDLVVGSPPCTEFSFSNKGGGGDFSEGLKDIVRFLEIVRFLRPKYWILENVPRTALVIEQGLKTAGHPLYAFKSLKPRIEIIDFSNFGLPQSRRRCLVGNFPFELLGMYIELAKMRTLGDIVSSLSATDNVVDPIWGCSIPSIDLSEMEPEPPLDAEQLRMNMEAKRFHPVYNDMSFPDRLDRPSRTVTATCTRVSRESIVIRDRDADGLRRLTLRERASLQSFPVTYQFFAKSHSTKVKMIGNAVPPLFSFFAGMSCREKSVEFTKTKLQKLGKEGLQIRSVSAQVPTSPHSVSEKFPERRRFRAALPGLRFKSGMRFELANEFNNAEVLWKIRFFFGPSKDIKTVDLSRHLLRSLKTRSVLRPIISRLDETLSIVEAFLDGLSPRVVQQSWTRRVEAIGPYQIVDLIGLASAELVRSLALVDSSVLAEIALTICGASIPSESQGSAKIRRHAIHLVAGFLAGSFFNQSTCAGGKGYPLRATPVTFEISSCKTTAAGNSVNSIALADSRIRLGIAQRLQLSGSVA